jgi:hypothetical protein
VASLTYPSGMLLRMATPELSRRVLLLVAGIVGLAVLIGLCVATLVVLFDRFTAKPARDCAATHCRTPTSHPSGSPVR